MDALLAIKPEFAQKILSGEKGYEFRRTTFNDPSDVDYIYLYASSPEQCVVGAFKTNRIVKAQPRELWNLFNDVAGIDRERFFDYFDGADTGHAIRVDETHRFDKCINPDKKLDNFSVPMSFCYLDDAQSETFRGFLPTQGEGAQSPPLARFTEE